ncbi:MAG: sugar ABC transporter substrate-binding protein [Actinomycetaceae bacterium]|nr:sugar ABC transporter substrate-binding protein [Actinomycetaceae bacterium]
MSCRRKNTAVLVAGITALSLGLAGCGAGGGATDSESNELTVLVESGGRSELTPIKDAYEAETGNKITFVELPYDSLYDRVNTELSAGSASYDVAALDAIWLSAFAPGLTPLDDLITEDVQSDLFPALIDEAQIDGKFIGAPVWTNAQVLFYRTDLFSDPEQQAAFEAEFGRELTPPATWEEYMEVAKFFTQDTDGDGSFDLYGTDVKGAVETEWLALILQAGAKDMVLDADGNVTINDEFHKAALDAYIAPVEAGIAPAGAAQTDWATAQNAFNQGQLAMTRFWAHAYTQIPADSPAAGNVGVVPMPAGPGGFGAVPGAWYLTIPQATGKQELAKEFIAYALEHNELGLDTELGLAATVSALEGASAERPNIAGLMEALDAEGTQPRPATAKWQQIVDSVLIPMLQEASAGGADTTALLDRAAEQVEEIMN